MILGKLAQEVRRELQYAVGADGANADCNDVFRSISLALHHKLIDLHQQTRRHFDEMQIKGACYLPIELLIGQSRSNNALNMGSRSDCVEALDAIGHNLGEISVHQSDNGNTETSRWLIERTSEAQQIPAYGHIEHIRDQDAKGEHLSMWLGWKTVFGAPFDTTSGGFARGNGTYAATVCSSQRQGHLLAVLSDGRHRFRPLRPDGRANFSTSWTACCITTRSRCWRFLKPMCGLMCRCLPISVIKNHAPVCC